MSIFRTNKPSPLPVRPLQLPVPKGSLGQSPLPPKPEERTRTGKKVGR